MYNLLDYLIQSKQYGSSIYDPYGAPPTQEGVLSQVGIDITDPKALATLPTYDQTGRNIALEEYGMGVQGRRAGARGSLMDITQQGQYAGAKAGFASQFPMETTRQDVLRGYGQEAQQAYLGLQEDIYGIDKAFQEQLLAGVGGLDPESWTFDESGDNYTVVQKQCIGNCMTGGMNEAECITQCTGGGGGNGNGNDIVKDIGLTCAQQGLVECPSGECVTASYLCEG